MPVMSKADLDWLTDGASPEEMKRVMRLVQEWSQGDEHSFPVQLALLTRAQWRATARIPTMLDESRAQLESKLKEQRQEAASIVRGFTDLTQAKIAALDDIVETNSRSMAQARTQIERQVDGAVQVSRQIAQTLEQGAVTWQRAVRDYESARKDLETVRRDLEERMRSKEWILTMLIYIGLVAVGIAISRYLPQWRQ